MGGAIRPAADLVLSEFFSSFSIRAQANAKRYSNTLVNDVISVLRCARMCWHNAEKSGSSNRRDLPATSSAYPLPWICLASARDVASCNDMWDFIF